MITRRCSERRFFMRPDASTNNAFVYCLAVAAHKYDVDVLFTCAMSNHHHTGIVDKCGQLPEFLAYFHKLFAKHQNALRGRWEAFWAPEQTSAVELIESDDVMSKMVYALTNPVKDNMVKRVNDWPGVNSLAAILSNRPLTAEKPKTFFRADGLLPAQVALSFRKPAALEHLQHAAYVAEIEQRVAVVEERAAVERVETGRSVVGRRAVLMQSWETSPLTKERRRGVEPRIACRNIWRRIESLQRSKLWVAKYRAARDAFLAGVEVVFPAGTFWLHRFAGVLCEPLELGELPQQHVG